MGSFLVRNGLILALLVLVPIFVGEYWAYQLGLYFLYALAAMGVGLTWGQAGILPLGQGMFVALGAYAAAYGLFGVGGSPESFVRAGMLGLPLMVAIIGGEPHRFRPLIDLYRKAGQRAGHVPEKLIVGLHSIGFLADTTDQAADDFFPGYAHTFNEIGKERGWSRTTRAQFDATRGPTGALLIGDAKTVAEKVLYVNEALGGISRLTFQMGVSTLPHPKMMRAIEILGTELAPMVRKALAKPAAAV